MAKRKKMQRDEHTDQGGDDHLSGALSAKKRKLVCSLNPKSNAASTDDEQHASSSPRSSALRKNDSPLLSLPAELRNTIYRYALLEPDEIEVERQQHMQPALLRICRQVRSEASPMFYNENKFKAVSTDLSAIAPATHWTNTKVSDSNLDIFAYGDMSWANLKSWLKRYHAREIAGMGPGGEQKRFEVVARAFGMVEEMEEVQWSVVENVLEQFREAVAAKDGTWTWTK